MKRPDYSAHEHLLIGLRARPELWRMGVGLLVAVAVMFALIILTQGILASRAPTLLDGMSGDAPGNTPASLLVMLGSYGFASLGVMAAGLMIYHRGAARLLGGWQRCWRQFRRAMTGLLILYAVSYLLPPWSMGAPLEPNLSLSLWLTLLPLSLLAVLVQVSAEEILFRGYLQQTLAARFSNPLIWMVVPTILFALGHYMPAQAGENAILIAVWAGFFGLAAADLTARSGTLGPAIALHLANNVSALLLVSMQGSLSGLSLYLAPFSMADATDLRPWLIVDLFGMLCAWLAVRLALRV